MPPVDRSRELDRWARALRRLDRACVPSQSHPVVRLADKRRRPDGTGPARAAWGQISKGVYLTHLGRYVVKVRVAGKLRYIGTFTTQAEAEAAVKSQEEITP